MSRWTNENFKPVNYVTAKLEWLMMSDKEWPHFVITKWNRDTKKVEVIEPSCQYIEWELIDLEHETYEWEGKTTHRIVFSLVDEEWNDIKWTIWYWATSRKVLQKLSALPMKGKEIGKVRFSTWRYNMEVDGKTRTWNYVTVWVNWEKWDDPYDYAKDIQPKIREVKDPETWEVVKRVTTELDAWIFDQVIPAIKTSIRIRNVPVASEEAEEQKEDKKGLDNEFEF